MHPTSTNGLPLPILIPKDLYVRTWKFKENARYLHVGGAVYCDAPTNNKSDVSAEHVKT